MSESMDISDTLREQIYQLLKKNLKAEGVQESLAALNNGGGFEWALQYAREMGKAYSGALQAVLIPENLPNGELYYNIIQKTVVPVLEGEYDAVARAAMRAQANVYAAEGIGLRPIAPNMDRTKLINLADRLAHNNDMEQDLEERLFLIGEDVMDGFSRGAVMDTMKQNADFQDDAGFVTTYTRDAGDGGDRGYCCDWCLALAGTYSAGSTPEGFWQAHDNCTCTWTTRAGRKVTGTMRFETGENGRLRAVRN